jgi:hypothetical protein
MCIFAESFTKQTRNMDFNKFIRIITEGGTLSEINTIFDALLDFHKKYDNYDFWKEHIK